MRRINKYIYRAVASSVLAVLFVILSLDAIGTLLDQLGDLRGDYDFVQAMVYVCFLLPGKIYLNIPFSVLVGALIGLGMLANNSELTVIRAAGVSVSKIVWAVMKPVLLFVVISLVLGEYVTPTTNQVAEGHKAVSQGGQGALESSNGLWNREKNEFMHFNAVLPNGVLFGVTRYRFSPDGQLISSSFSERATFQRNHWLEENVRETVIDELATVEQRFITRAWNTELRPDLLNLVVSQPEDLSISSLYAYANYLGEQQQENADYWLNFWKKVLQPLAIASLVIIAVSFVFGPLREVSMGNRIFSGVVVGIIFRLSQDLLGPSSLVFGFSPLVAVLVPILMCLSVGFFLLRKAG